MKIGEILIGIRKNQNLTMEEVAIKCNLSKAYISRLEKAAKDENAPQIKPSIETLKKIAKGLNLSFEDLYFVVDEDEDTINTTSEVHPNQDYSLSVKETKIISKYRNLDTYGKEAVDSIVDIEHRRCKNN